MDECKRKAFVMLLDVDKAFCMETYISSTAFDQTRRLLVRKFIIHNSFIRADPTGGYYGPVNTSNMRVPKSQKSS